jgi:hypothetical protein
MGRCTTAGLNSRSAEEVRAMLPPKAVGALGLAGLAGMLLLLLLALPQAVLHREWGAVLTPTRCRLRTRVASQATALLRRVSFVATKPLGWMYSAASPKRVAHCDVAW